jgi:hypothetical protein
VAKICVKVSFSLELGEPEPYLPPKVLDPQHLLLQLDLPLPLAMPLLLLSLLSLSSWLSLLLSKKMKKDRTIFLKNNYRK